MQYSHSNCDGLGSFGHGGDTCCGTIFLVLFGLVLSVNLALKIQAAVQYNVCTVGDKDTKTICTSGVGACMADKFGSNFGFYLYRSGCPYTKILRFESPQWFWR